MSRAQAIVVVIMVFLSAQPAFAQGSGATWKDVSVTLRDGWSYAKVIVRVDDSDPTALLVTRPDGATKRVPVADVQMIRDVDGRDITAQILPVPVEVETPYYSEIGVAAPAGASSAAGTSGGGDRTYPFSAMLSAGLGYGHPFHDFYEGMQDRVSWHVQVRMPVEPRTYLTVIYRNQQLYRGGIEIYDPDDGQTYTVDTALDLQEILFLFGFLGKLKHPGAARAYFEIGGGLGIHSGTLSYDGQTANDSFNRFLLVGQFGVMVPLGQGGAGLDFGISLAGKIFSTTSGEPSGFVGGIHGALTYAFGQK